PGVASRHHRRLVPGGRDAVCRAARLHRDHRLAALRGPHVDRRAGSRERARALSRHARVSPELHESLAAALHAYVTAVIGDEWDAMSRGAESATAQTAFDHLWHTYRQLPVHDDRELAAQIETMRRMNDLAANRHLRLLRSRSKIPPVLWLGLLGGALLTMVFSYFFGARSTALQIFLTAGFAATVSLFIFVIVILDAPFAGANPVSREPFRRALRVMAAEGP